jgi:hypothetical protein
VCEKVRRLNVAENGFSILLQISNAAIQLFQVQKLHADDLFHNNSRCRLVVRFLASLFSD